MTETENNPKIRSVSISSMNTSITVKSEYEEDTLDVIIKKAEKLADKYDA